MSKEVKCRLQPCDTCPYRKDAPSGLWAAHEYEKLREYDLPTGEQPPMAFHCHTSPDFLCNGWAIVHGSQAKRGYEALGLRFAAAISQSPIEIPEPVVPLFSTGTEAAEHGLRDIQKPKRKAVNAIRKLQKVRARKAAR